MDYRKLATWALGVLLALVLLAIPTYVVIVYFTHPPSASEQIKGELTDDGSSVLGLWNGVISTAYHEQTGVIIVPGVSSSGTGIQNVQDNKVNVGLSDVPANMPGLTSVPLLVSAVAAVYYLPGVGTLHLNGHVLAAMYTGNITYWDDPAIQLLNKNVKLPHILVSPMERGDSSGSTFQFLSYLNKQSDTGWPLPAMTVPWPVLSNGHSHVVNGSDAVLNKCKVTIGCVAYIGVSYAAQAEQAGLKVAALSNRSGQFVLPTLATIEQALAQYAGQFPANGQLPMVNGPHGYPIIELEWGIVNDNQTDTKVVPAEKAFLNWLITVGASSTYTTPVDFVPLPSQEEQIAKNEIASINTTHAIAAIK